MKSAFTLIELMIVIAIIGIIAVTVFVLINPAEMMARGRDTGRITAVAVMGRALVEYRTIIAGTNYPAEEFWDTELTAVESLNNFPTGADYKTNGVSACSINARPVAKPTYCYRLSSNDEEGAIIYTKLESAKNILKCPGQLSYFAFSSVDGKSGIICENDEPAPWVSGSKTYVQ